MSCYENKPNGLGLLFVINAFEASKKCQVSLVVQYNSLHTLFSQGLDNTKTP